MPAPAAEGSPRCAVWRERSTAGAGVLLPGSGVVRRLAIDEPGPDGSVADAGRVAFLREHLTEVVAARRDGVPVEAYFAWSLMDNFEWRFGYGKRFGIVHTDYHTFERRVKDSGKWYAQVINGNQSQSVILPKGVPIAIGK